MGKGSGRRPTQVGEEEFEDRWEMVFKRGGKNGDMKHHRKSEYEKRQESPVAYAERAEVARQRQEKGIHA